MKRKRAGLMLRARDMYVDKGLSSLRSNQGPGVYSDNVFTHFYCHHLHRINFTATELNCENQNRSFSDLFQLPARLLRDDSVLFVVKNLDESLHRTHKMHSQHTTTQIEVHFSQDSPSSVPDKFSSVIEELIFKSSPSALAPKTMTEHKHNPSN